MRLRDGRPRPLIFGTDAPPLKVLKKQGVEVIKKIGLSPVDENKVYYENAKRLLKIWSVANTFGELHRGHFVKNARRGS